MTEGEYVGRAVGIKLGRLVGLIKYNHLLSATNFIKVNFFFKDITLGLDLWVLEMECLLGLKVGMSAESWAVLWVETKAVYWDVG